MLIPASPARLRRKPHDRFTAPHAHLYSIHTQLVRKTHGEPFSFLIVSSRLHLHPQTELGRALTSGLHCVINGGDHRTRYVIGTVRSRPEQSRTDDCWM